MKELSTSLKYETKGELFDYASGLLETVNKKGESDEIDFNDLLISIENFCEQNKGREVVVKFTALAKE